MARRRKPTADELVAFTGKMPAWVPDALDNLMEVAEELFDDGATRKRWVTAALKAALDAHDIPWLPDPIEHAIEDKASQWVGGLIDRGVDQLIELFHVDPERRRRRKLAKVARRVDRGKWPASATWTPQLGFHDRVSGDTL